MERVMSEFSMAVKLEEDALKVPDVRRVIEEAATAAGRMLEDTMPKSVISGAGKLIEKVAALPR